MSRENPRYVDPIEFKAFLESNSYIQNTVDIRIRLFFYYAKGLAILVCLGRADRAEQYSTKIPDNLHLSHLLRIQIPYVKIYRISLINVLP